MLFLSLSTIFAHRLRRPFLFIVVVSGVHSNDRTRKVLSNEKRFRNQQQEKRPSFQLRAIRNDFHSNLERKC